MSRFLSMLRQRAIDVKPDELCALGLAFFPDADSGCSARRRIELAQDWPAYPVRTVRMPFPAGPGLQCYPK